MFFLGLRVLRILSFAFYAVLGTYLELWSRKEESLFNYKWIINLTSPLTWLVRKVSYSVKNESRLNRILTGFISVKIPIN